MEHFLSRHKKHITGVLSGYDRMLFRGTLRSISHVGGMQIFLDYHHVLLKNFGAFVQAQSTRLKEHAQAFARAHGRPLKYIASAKISKEAMAKSVMQEDRITDGLICVLSCVEPCQSYEIRKDRASKHIHLVPSLRKCIHLYFYFLDREFGFMHVRLQTWFPFAIQVCINGRQWLAHEMDKTGIQYQQSDNCFIEISDIEKAQKISDDTLKRNWHKLLDRFAEKLNPLVKELDIHSYYWTIRQAEYATDIMFKNTDSLKNIYRQLIHHAIENFSSEDIMRFLGRRTSNSRFKGEAISSMSRRYDGIRVKHWVEENSIKMYDKQQFVLRIETTINNPRRFKVFREGHCKGQKIKSWQRMRKGIADIYRRTDVARAANARYLNALSVVGDETPSHQLLDSVSDSVRKNKRRYRALRPIAPMEAKLFQSVLHEQFLLHGFRNADIRPMLFPNCTSHEEQRNVGRTSRLISLLRAHKLVQKVPKTRLYRISKKGHLVMSTSLLFRNSSIAMLNNAV